MNQTIEHRGYSGSVEISIEDNCLHGKILHIRDLVTYEAESLPQLRVDFMSAVDNYLATCKRLGVEPKKPYSGTFNVRIGPDLHLDAVGAATRRGVSLNDFVKDAIAREVERSESGQTVHHHYHHTFVIRKNLGSEQSEWSEDFNENITLDRFEFGSNKVVNH